MRPDLALRLGALALLAACSTTPATPPGPDPALLAARAAVETGRAELDAALIQQQDTGLWDDVVASTAAAREAFAAAAPFEELAEEARAGRITADGIDAWQAILIDAAVTGNDAAVHGPTEGGPNAEQIIARLLEVEGTLPETAQLLAELDFERELYDEAAETLDAALSAFPEDAGLHESARAWRDLHPDPATLVATLDAALEARTASGALAPALTARVLATQAFYLHNEGLVAYGEADLPAAAELFERSARSFSRSDALVPTLDPLWVAALEAGSWVYAGWSHYYQAENTDAEDRAGRIAHLVDAERCFLAGLRARPGDEAATLGIDFVGDFYVNPEKLDDMDQAREFFGRVAPRADNATWWNNAAFFGRETGTAAELAGDPERAMRLWERSYQAYERCIELAPDNARWTNDTGLMLLYHLGRDLDRAEALFERAWELGRDVCENPFVDEAVFEENFSAYTDAMLNLARMWAADGRLPEAKEVIDELVELAPLRPDARATQAQIDLALRGGSDAADEGPDGDAGAP